MAGSKGQADGTFIPEGVAAGESPCTGIPVRDLVGVEGARVCAGELRLLSVTNERSSQGCQGVCMQSGERSHSYALRRSVNRQPEEDGSRKQVVGSR